ncbi:MAG TPA: STAS domain-containing protein [Candidatus Acidoferrales bacterium]|nr:STAS domain-containing protein [Candidatus Acidoferrales bacterium]
MPLRISMRRLSDVNIVDLDGRLIIGPESEALSERLQELSRQGARKILVNLEKVTQLDSSGICSLLQGYTAMKHAGGSFKLLHPGGHTREVLEVMRLTETIPTLDDEAQALASFVSAGPAVR